MDVKIIKNKKDSLEIEIDDNIILPVIADTLIKNGVDAYFYNPHPLLPGFRLHIDSDKPIGTLKNAIKIVKDNLNEFAQLLQVEMK